MSPRAPSKPPDLALQAMSQTDLTERELQNRAVEVLRKLGFDVTVFSDKRKTRTAIRGVPDLYVQHQGRRLRAWIEMKALGETTRPEQERFLSAENASGGMGYVCDSMERLDAILKDMGVT